ncbi:MAG TPA: hypothetical protein VIC57_13720 [Candidatus Dormibacteraeota bacterium]|jgi:hypothetical protein
MSQRQLHDQIRRAFSALTRPPRPQLTERIRDSLWHVPAPSGPGGRRLAVPLIAGLLVVLLAVAAVLEAPAVVGTVAGAGRAVSSQVARMLQPPRTAATPTPSPRPSATPAASPSAAATPTPVPAETATAAPVPTAPPAAPAPPPATLPGFTCAQQYGGGGQATIATARVGAQSGYDRFVIQFNGAVPAFTVTPQDSATFAQSGGPVQLAGSYGLAVVLQNTSGAAFSGPRELHPGFSMLQEARMLSDSQGVVQWGIGIARPACFHAWALESPFRLVIDIAAP